MRALILAVGAAVTLSPNITVAQGEWGNVKSWTGTVTIVATDNQAVGNMTSKMTWKASGPFTITDGMMPAGAHMQWPMPGVEEMSDPKKAETAYDRWQARVVASYEQEGLDEQGKPYAYKCTADNQQAARFGVTINPMAPTYVVNVSPPVAIFKCSGAGAHAPPNGHLQMVGFELTGPRGVPGPKSGTKTFNASTQTITVSYSMGPTK
jgi:hypothetical protein